MNAPRSVIIGVFTEPVDAQQAIAELKRAGFADDQIGVARRHEEATTAEGATDTYAGEGALAGVATGAGLGALWGLGIAAGVLPAIGPAIAGGTLAAILASAAAGAAAAGLAGTLVGLGIPREEAEYYEEELKAGRTIVAVTARGREIDAGNILRRFGGYDISDRFTMGQERSAEEEAIISPHPVGMAASPMAASPPPSTFASSRPHSHGYTTRETSAPAGFQVGAHVPNRPTPEHTTIHTPIRREEVKDETEQLADKERQAQSAEIPIRVEEIREDVPVEINPAGPSAARRAARAPKPPDEDT